MKEGILVVDVGTSKVHINLLDVSTGDLVLSNASSYSWIHPKEGWSEVDPASIWQAAEKSVKAVVSSAKGVCDIKAVAFSYIGDSLLPVDKELNPLGNMILAFDARAKQETLDFKEKFGEEKFSQITGSPLIAEFVPFKMLWIKKNQPEIFKKTARFWTIQQYMNHRLNLADVNDYTLACRKLLIDVKKKNWSPELCEFLQVTPEMLGEDIRTADSMIGTIKNFGSVNFEHEIPVILGAHDSECGMLGLGCLPGSDKVIGNITGTYDHVGYLTKDYIEKLVGFTTSYCGPLKDSFVFMGATIAGPNLDWFVNTFYPSEGLGAINRLFAATLFDGTNKLYLTRGIQTGDGCITGLNFGTTLENLFVAIIEGVTYPLKGSMAQMKVHNGRNFGAMRVGGGGAKSEKWLQLKANMFDIQVEKVKNIEISSVGTAIMAAVNLGCYSDYESAMQKMIGIKSVFKPLSEIVQRYDERYNDFLSS